MTKLRQGATLVELLVALPLMAVLSASAVLALLATQRLVRSTDGVVTTNRELRHAVAALASELRPLRAADLVAWSDTSLELNTIVGAGIVCDGRSTARTIDLLPNSSADAARTAWNAPAQAGDAIVLWFDRAATPSLQPEQARARLSTVSPARGCTNAPLLQRAPTPDAPIQRLTLVDPLNHPPLLGAPVRIMRRVRLALYRGGDGDWYIGRTTWNGAAWDIIQPVVGPLLAPSRFGLRIEVRDSAGIALHSGSALSAQLHVEFRAPRRSPSTSRLGAPTLVDSAVVDLSLRGDRDGAPRAN